MSVWTHILDEKFPKKDMEQIVARTILHRNKFPKKHIKGKLIKGSIQHYRTIVRSGKYVPSTLSNSRNTMELHIENILQNPPSSNISIQKPELMECDTTDFGPWVLCR